MSFLHQFTISPLQMCVLHITQGGQSTDFSSCCPTISENNETSLTRLGKLHDPLRHSRANCTAPVLTNDLRPRIAECFVRCSRFFEHKTIIGELIDTVSCSYTCETLCMKVSGAQSVINVSTCTGAFTLHFV